MLVAEVLPVKFHSHLYFAREPQRFRHAWQLNFVKAQLGCLLLQPYVVARCQEIGAHTKNLKRASVHPRNPLHQQNHGAPYSGGMRGNYGPAWALRKRHHIRISSIHCLIPEIAKSRIPLKPR